MEAKRGSTGHVPSTCSVSSPVYQQPSLEGETLKESVIEVPVTGQGASGVHGRNSYPCECAQVRGCVCVRTREQAHMCERACVYACARECAHVCVSVSVCAWERACECERARACA